MRGGREEKLGQEKIQRRKLTRATNHRRQVPKRVVAIVISSKVNPRRFRIGGEGRGGAAAGVSGTEGRDKERERGRGE